MVNKIYELKNKLLERVEKDMMERGVERIDVKEMGELIDMVKDLAEAESSCWQAQYYRSVTEAMGGEKQGYGAGTGSSATPGYQGGRQGYGNQGGRQGYDNMQYGYGGMNRGYGNSMGHQDVMEPLRMAIQSAGPDEREHLRKEVSQIIGKM